jgi:hypothetical protein
MATQTANVASLYEDVVADLIPYYDNFVLLPNPSIIMNSYNISGGIGNTMKIPVTNAWTAATGAVSENTGILGINDQDFIPTSVSLTVNKRGAGTQVSEESLEDGGMDTVRNAIVTRLSRSLAQASDQAGMNLFASGSEAALTDIANVDISNDGTANAAQLTGADVSLVFSPEGGAYAMKREPTVKMFNDIDADNYDMIATVRNGFARVRDNFFRAVIASNVIAESSDTLKASLDQFSSSVANLRAVNAPTSGSGYYIAAVTPAHELHLAKELNGVGGISSGSIGSVSQDLANQALLEGLIGQAIGCQFVRSNNLPRDLASA